LIINIDGNNRRYENVGFYVTEKRKEKEENIFKKNEYIFFLQRSRKIQMEKGGNNWTRKILFAGRRKTEKEIRKTQNGKETEGNILKRGKYLEKERIFLEDMKKEEKDENIFWRRRRRMDKEEEENIWRTKIFLGGGEGEGRNCLEKENIFGRKEDE